MDQVKKPATAKYPIEPAAIGMPYGKSSIDDLRSAAVFLYRSVRQLIQESAHRPISLGGATAAGLAGTPE